MHKIYIIEHLEPEVFPWCLIEYKNISKIAGKENLWFCNLNGVKGVENLSSLGKCIKESVCKLALKNACVLDPDAEKTLSSEESKKFQYFIFGGILGDYPPKKRTKKELSSFLPHALKYNIGKEQMSTDNAVYVVKQIIKGKKLNEIPF
ncbi:MAG: RNA methyltransferase, partial [Nanoarchaeota archaeon]